MQDTHQSKGHRLQRIRVVLSPVAEQEQALEHLLRGEVGGEGERGQQSSSTAFTR